MHPHAVNSMLVENLGTQETLVCACDDGDILVYYTKKIQETIDIINEKCTEEEAIARRLTPLVRLNVGKSAWGISIHSNARLLAVSSNTYDISVFSFGLTDDSVLYNDPDTEWQYPGRSKDTVITLTGHHQNIPSVSFFNSDLDKEGRYLVSIDLTGLIFIWDLRERNRVKQILPTVSSLSRHPHNGWSVVCLDPRSFLWTRNDLEYLGCKMQADSQGTLDITQGRHQLRDSSLQYQNTPSSRLRNASDFSTPSGLHRMVNLTRLENFIRNSMESTDGPIADELVIWEEDETFPDYGLDATGVMLSSDDGEDIFGVDEEDELDYVEETDELDLEEPISSSPITSARAGFSGFESAVQGLHDIFDETETVTGSEDEESGEENSYQLFETYDVSPGLDRGLYRGLALPDSPMPGADTDWLLPYQPDPPSLSMPESVISGMDTGKSSSRTMYDLDSSQVPFLIFHTGQDFVNLHAAPFRTILATCRDPCHQHLPLSVSWLSHHDRLHLTNYIPELNLVITATATGRAAIFTLTRKLTKLGHGNEHAMRLDWVLPLASQELQGHRPHKHLIGIATAPLQGSLKETVGKTPSRRWRLFLTYSNHTILSYELWRGEANETAFVEPLI
jgi:hypothetical protein